MSTPTDVYLKYFQPVLNPFKDIIPKTFTVIGILSVLFYFSGLKENSEPQNYSREYSKSRKAFYIKMGEYKTFKETKASEIIKHASEAYIFHEYDYSISKYEEAFELDPSLKEKEFLNYLLPIRGKNFEAYLNMLSQHLNSLNRELNSCELHHQTDAIKGLYYKGNYNQMDKMRNKNNSQAEYYFMKRSFSEFNLLEGISISYKLGAVYILSSFASAFMPRYFDFLHEISETAYYRKSCVKT